MILLENKKMNFYFLVKKEYIAGACLLGSEVKSIKSKHVSITNSFITINNLDVFLNNCIINPLHFVNHKDCVLRKIKLLLKKKEIFYLYFFVKKKGFTIVVKNIFLKKNKIKFTICLVVRKQLIDKRFLIKKKNDFIDIKKIYL